jgi:2-oxoisovalerate dehydrogenase E1 component
MSAAHPLQALAGEAAIAGTVDPALLRQASLIRAFEERLLALYAQGQLRGTVHTCIGQELVGVAVAAQHRRGDWLFSNHRGHGHYLALTGDYTGLFRELLGRPGGVSHGHGGSQHLLAEGFMSNGIQGGMVPVALGRALAQKMDGQGSLSCIFIGDGTLGQGNVYEGLNIASKWGLPLLMVLEHNGIAQTTPSSHTVAGEVADRPRAFGVRTLQCDTADPAGVLACMAQAVDIVRSRCQPVFVEVRTTRLRPHSKGDDTRSRQEIDALWAHDPLLLWQRAMEQREPGFAAAIDREIDTHLAQALQPLEGPAAAAARADLDAVAAQAEGARAAPRARLWQPLGATDPGDELPEGIGKRLNHGIKRLMAERPEAVFLGEDVLSPYGGAFKIARDLSDLHPDRVLATPISEASLVGIGTGLALAGRLPLVEIMFGDFLTLGFDQLLNHATKFRGMFGRPLAVPLLVRTPMGGYRGYGPTHSQSIEKHFMGMPELDVVALNARVCPAALLQGVAQDLCRPTLLVENKVLYTEALDTRTPPGFVPERSDDPLPWLRLRPLGRVPQVTVVCYGYMLGLVEAAVQAAFDQHEVVCEVLCPTLIAPLDPAPVLASLAGTGTLLCVEEGGTAHGFGAEVIARCLQAGASLRRAQRIGCRGLIPAASEEEKRALPDVERIVDAILALAGHG